MSTVAGMVMVAGAVFVLLAGIGIVRFPDIYARMHAAAKGPTLGLMLTALGAGLTFQTAGVWLTLLIVVVLQVLTGPVGTHLVGRAIHRTMRPDVDEVDELARDDRDAG